MHTRDRILRDLATAYNLARDHVLSRPDLCIPKGKERAFGSPTGSLHAPNIYRREQDLHTIPLCIEEKPAAPSVDAFSHLYSLQDRL